MQETWVRSPGWEDPLGKGTATYSSILVWRIPWTEEPGRLQSTGSQRVRHDWATEHSIAAQSSQVHGDRKQMRVSRDLGEWEIVNYYLTGTEFLCLGWWKALEMGSGDGCTLWTGLTPLNCTLKKGWTSRFYYTITHTHTHIPPHIEYIFVYYGLPWWLRW